MNIKFKKNFFDNIFFLIKNSKSILNLKNIVILLLAKNILKKIMWFY